MSESDQSREASACGQEKVGEPTHLYRSPSSLSRPIVAISDFTDCRVESSSRLLRNCWFVDGRGPHLSRFSKGGKGRERVVDGWLYFGA